jgi:hemoglobin
MDKEKSLYEQLGGEAAVNQAVDIFYRKVIEDPLLTPFFEGMDMKRQVNMQRSFLSAAFGGPKPYSGRGMRTAHTPLVAKGLGDAHFDAVLKHLLSTLEELGVSKSLRDWAQAITESMRKDILVR